MILLKNDTVQKMKFSIKDFFSKSETSYFVQCENSSVIGFLFDIERSFKLSEVRKRIMEEHDREFYGESCDARCKT